MDQLGSITAADVGRAAQVGDPLAVSILQAAGEQLGKGLSMVIDLLNPERIVIGSIFARCREQLWPCLLYTSALLLLVALTVYIAEEPWAIWAVLGGAALLGGAIYYGYRWVYLPFRETEKMLELFVDGYSTVSYTHLPDVPHNCTCRGCGATAGCCAHTGPSSGRALPPSRGWCRPGSGPGKR